LESNTSRFALRRMTPLLRWAVPGNLVSNAKLRNRLRQT